MADVKKTKDSAAAVVALEEWFGKLEEYERKFGVTVDDDNKILAVKRILSNEDFDRALRGRDLTTFGPLMIH
eukprot:2619949-Karenia_brevis.AAC.1